MTSYEQAALIAQLLDNKKAIDIEVLNIRELTSLGDYFVIASGASDAQMRTLQAEIEDKLSQKGIEPRRIEGERSSVWILLDYGDVIVHLFHKDTRDFYCLERLWADAEKLDLSTILPENN